MPEPTETTTQVDTDLPTPSATASPAETPGPAENISAADQPTEQPENHPDTISYEQVVWPEEVSFEPTQVAAFKELAGELNLSAEQVQKLVDFEAHASQEKEAQLAAEQREQIRQWAEQTKAPFGTGLETAITFAWRAADAFGGPDLRNLLEETGLGNHPVIIRTLSGIGRAISEDACPGGKPSAPQDKTFAEALYGTK